MAVFARITLEHRDTVCGETFGAFVLSLLVQKLTTTIEKGLTKVGHVFWNVFGDASE
jgi:hypothetical protein